MFSPRSIPARPPFFDREVVRAAALNGRGGPWPRTPAGLARLVADHFERPDGRWVAEPEAELLRALIDRLPAAGPAGPPIAAPAWGAVGFADVLTRFHRVHWMEPAQGRLDPGPSEVAQALEEGAHAVLLAPVAGDGQALPETEKLCRAAGAPLAVDARATVGTRILDGGPERFGDLLLLPPDGEPVPGPCPGAILCGDGNDTTGADRVGPTGFRYAIASFLESLRDEPRLRRWWIAPAGPPRGVVAATSLPPPWTVATAAVRLGQSPGRAVQRARHAQVMRVNLGNLPAVEIVPDPLGFQSAGGAFPLIAQGRDEVVDQLRRQGIPNLGGIASWLAPPGARGPRATLAAERALLLPLHPFFRPEDIEAIGERLRRATLLTNGTGLDDPTEAPVGEDGEG